MKIIDPHLHLFNLEQGDYAWLKSENPPFWPDKHLIQQNFNETNLTLSEPLSLSGFVHIEAGFDNTKPWRELIELEETVNKPFKGIANIDLTLNTSSFQYQLNKLAELKSFIGVRHILDEQALLLLTNKQALSNFKLLNDSSLIFETQLPLNNQTPVNKLCDVVCDNPNINFIINHAGFPPAAIHTSEWQRWQNNLAKLAIYPHVSIKCSGWEMTDKNYKSDWLSENSNLIFNSFGATRMMLASNFPLCLFNKVNYQDYWQSIIESDFFQSKSELEKSALCYDNALHLYQIKL